ncbi:hypothetical protein PISMIDRAFT_691030 [Pisolithus microcarpus 441]|uniref:Uncharacterized protein n=1 Tax=Pisolithus microcarpus 441 TaxID=765257 RepID=A0A0C9XZT5_9AGAM|nr:hypothetical protein BKA83DRAFT_691030 [Pisolithus microcarpus]KIK10421.1 hypothetical protein PISMIDRAFT_691030 [Pisolithus microcarpus 441]
MRQYRFTFYSGLYWTIGWRQGPFSLAGGSCCFCCCPGLEPEVVAWCLAYYPTSHDCFLLVSLPSVYKQLLSSASSYDPVERDRLPHSYYCLEMLPVSTLAPILV